VQKLPDDADTGFSDHQTIERLYPDGSWVIRKQVEVDLADGDSRDGEYLCDHLRDLPPGSENWRADRVLLPRRVTLGAVQSAWSSIGPE
jgi:hypothetical protein